MFINFNLLRLYWSFPPLVFKRHHHDCFLSLSHFSFPSLIFPLSQNTICYLIYRKAHVLVCCLLLHTHPVLCFSYGSEVVVPLLLRILTHQTHTGCFSCRLDTPAVDKLYTHCDYMTGEKDPCVFQRKLENSSSERYGGHFLSQ